VLDSPIGFAVFAINLIIILTCWARIAKRLPGIVFVVAAWWSRDPIASAFLAQKVGGTSCVSVAPAYSNRAFAMLPEKGLVWTVLRAKRPS
jgi:hypothetical protein